MASTATSRLKASEEPLSPRDKLLASAMGCIRDRRIGDLSLRQIASELGTSHRMLIYHFGSKEGLMAALMKSVEEDSLRFFDKMRADQGIAPTEKLWRFWRFTTSTERAPGSRLWIEVFSKALGGSDYPGDLLPGIINSWVEPLSYICGQLGSAPEQAETEGRLVLGVVHGLALQFYATGNGEAADIAFAQFLTLLKAGRSSGT